MKYRILALAVLAIISITACGDDDDGLTTLPPRDRGEQALTDEELITNYLATHFYNYEEFANPPADFDYEIRFDTIAGQNADKTPLTALVDAVSVTRADITQNIYVLKAKLGAEAANENPASSQYKVTYADSVLLSYRGVELGDTQAFDGSNTPVWFDLPTTITGFYQGIEETHTSSGFTQNDDGTIAFNNDFASSAVFIPSGLAYFNDPPPNIGLYASLVFTFKTFQRKETDHDGDGIPSIFEDLNNNEFLFDADEDGDDGDNTDGDNVPNFRDPDDDNDGVRTAFELPGSIFNEDGNPVAGVFNPNTLLDTDGDGIPNHLDDDDDGDGRLTVDEISINQATGVITYTDSNADGVPDFLDPNN